MSTALRCVARTVSALCLGSSLAYVCVGSTTGGKKFYTRVAGKLFDDAKGGVPVLTLALPLLVAASTCALFLLARPARAAGVKISAGRCRGGGDASFNKISFVFLLLPCVAFLLATIERHLDKRRRLHEGHEHHSLSADDAVMEIGNAFGMTAMVAFSFFLVPVTKHSPLLALMDWNPIQAATMHIWCGRIAAIGVVTHGTMHMYRWVAMLGESLGGMLFPPAGCWGTGGPAAAELDDDAGYHEQRDHESHEDEGEDGGGGRFVVRALHEGHNHDGHGCGRRGLLSQLARGLHEGHDEDEDGDEACAAFQPTCADPRTDCTCYHHFRNFTGFLALIFIVVIVLSSLGPVRRRAFRAFYIIHMLSGPIVLASAVMHYHRMMLYIGPSVLYYAACSVPNWAQAWFSRSKDGGVKIVSVREIRCAAWGGRCVDLTLEATPDALRRYRPGQYVRVCVPSISSVWHPFTANPVLEGGRPRGDRIRLLFRAAGPFTNKLATALLRPGEEEEPSDADDAAERPSRPPPPVLLADAFHGPAGRLLQALRHDVVVMVAGGIGITPYLALLHELRSALAREEDGAGAARLVHLHWACRDESLIRFVREEYLDPLLAAGCRGELGEGDCGGVMRITIHKTGAAAVPSYSDAPEPEPEPEPELDGDADADEEGGEEEGAGNWPSNPFSKGEDGGIPSADFPAIVVDGPGAPLAQSRFASAARESVFGNLPYFLTFGTIAWAGLACVWYLYLRAVQRDDEVLPRVWGLAAVALVSLPVSLLANFVMDSTDSVVWGIGRRGGVKFSPVAEDEPAEMVELTRTKTKASREEGAALGQSALDVPSSAHVDSDDSADGHTMNGVTIETSRGRPDLYQLLDCLDGASAPALFLCGPTMMMKQIRSAAQGKCCGCCPSNTSIYEETFEL